MTLRIGWRKLSFSFSFVKETFPIMKDNKRRMIIMISALIEVAVSMVKLFIGLIKLIVKVVLGAMLIDWYMDRRATRKKVN